MVFNVEIMKKVKAKVKVKKEPAPIAGEVLFHISNI
jgi:hypothetical protein